MKCFPQVGKKDDLIARGRQKKGRQTFTKGGFQLFLALPKTQEGRWHARLSLSSEVFICLFIGCPGSLLGARASPCGGFSGCGAEALGQGFRSCDARASLPCGLWNPPGAGTEPVSPALAAGFVSAAPPGKSNIFFFGSFHTFKQLI